MTRFFPGMPPGLPPQPFQTASPGHRPLWRPTRSPGIPNPTPQHFPRNNTVRILVKLLLALMLTAALLAGAAGGLLWWARQPLPLAADSLEISVPPGASLRTVAQQAHAAGVRSPEWLLHVFFRASLLWQQWQQPAAPRASVKPGDYSLSRGITPGQMLDKLVKGQRIVLSVTLVEGWTLRQVRAALGKAPKLKQSTRDLSAEALMAALGRPGVPAEGRFFPDTYTYSRGMSDLDVLRLSLKLMDEHLQAAWEQRTPDLPLQSPDEALILASIVEKETGRAADRALVAGVFINRLKKGMKLQTDPTVIYGLGEAFDGNLRKRDLLADTPYNTYTREGLPPTPIAMPGRASLMAAVQPARTPALYFVARGDGSSHFSETLGEHNRAVNQYQRKVSP